MTKTIVICRHCFNMRILIRQKKTDIWNKFWCPACRKNREPIEVYKEVDK